MAEFGKLNFSVSFNPTSAFPIDARYYFDSLEKAQAAAATADEVGSSTTTYYYGETVVVVENDKAILYTIQPDKTLKEVGTAPVGDGASIVVEDNKVKIVGFDSAETGSQPRKKADGSIEWIKPDNTTVDGLQTSVSGLESDVQSLQENKANSADVYTKEEIDGKIVGIYHFKASIETYAELPSNPEVGDVYDIKTADAEHDINAGDNVAWNGTEWDNLRGKFDLSGYATKDEVSEKVDKVEGSRLITNEEAEKLAILKENAIETVDTDQFSIDENKKLSLLDIAMSKVTGLTDALANKVDKNEDARLMTNAEGEKLGAIEENAQKNILEVVNINGEALVISEKAVNVPIGGEVLGVVKSAEGDNNVLIADDGTMSVQSVKLSTLVQDETLILNGGTSVV